MKTAVAALLISMLLCFSISHAAAKKVWQIIDRDGNTLAVLDDDYINLIFVGRSTESIGCCRGKPSLACGGEACFTPTGLPD